jgi:hypothetical protein
VPVVVLEVLLLLLVRGLSPPPPYLHPTRNHCEDPSQQPSCPGDVHHHHQQQQQQHIHRQDDQL